MELYTGHARQERQGTIAYAKPENILEKYHIVTIILIKYFENKRVYLNLPNVDILTKTLT